MSKMFFDDSWLNAPSSEDRSKILEKKLVGLKPVVVFIDDDEEVLEILTSITIESGLECFAHPDYEEALEFIAKNRNRILFIFSDYKMPNINGFEFKEKVNNVAQEIPFFILSGYVDREMALKGIEYKIENFIEKPFDKEQLFHILQECGDQRLDALKVDFELREGFIDDASKLIEEIEETCLELEQDPLHHEYISKIFGMVHTIKGSSGFFEPKNLHNYSHAYENVLKDLLAGKLTVTPDLVSIMLGANDVLKMFLEEFKNDDHGDHNIEDMVQVFANIGNGEIVVSNKQNVDQSNDVKQIDPTQIKDKKASDIRVSVKLLDEFMQTSGEMTVLRNMINKTVRSLEKQYTGDKEIGLLSELLEEMQKINSEIQNKISDLRKVSAGLIVKPLGRVVRDTALSLKKEIDFEVEGESVRLDNSVAEALSKSLVHMLRNSVDHGVEAPQSRVEKSKNPKGKLGLSFNSDGDNIIIKIKDDGAGINAEKIREKVIEKGLKSREEALRMSNNELNHMIFDAGFSTASEVTEYSGRGVGMSMVKDCIDGVKGKIHINTEIGVGTNFCIEIPVPKSVIIMNCLFVGVGETSYGIPQDRILKVIEKDQLTSDQFIYYEGGNALKYDDMLIPVCSVSKLLGGVDRSEREELIIVVKSEKTFYAVMVESVLDIEDAVLKNFNLLKLKKLELFLGGTFLADGSIGLVFDIDGMAKMSNISNKSLEQYETNKNNVDYVSDEERRNVIIFALDHKQQYCIEEKEVFRIEMFERSNVQIVGSEQMIPYRESIVTLINLSDILCSEESDNSHHSNDVYTTIVVKNEMQYIGLVVKSIIDLKEIVGHMQEHTKKQYGLSGCFIVDEHVVSNISLQEVISHSPVDENSFIEENQAA